MKARQCGNVQIKAARNVSYNAVGIVKCGKVGGGGGTASSPAGPPKVPNFIGIVKFGKVPGLPEGGEGEVDYSQKCTLVKL